MQTVYEILEWERIKGLLSIHTRTQIGRHMTECLEPLEKGILEEEAARTSEMILCLDRYGRLPIDSGADISHLLDLASKGGRLSVEELETVCHDVSLAKDCSSYFKKSQDSPKIQEKLLAMSNMDFLEADIHKIIAPDLSIYDNASPELRRIRSSMKRLEKQITAELGVVLEANKEYLSDTTLTLRNGHYVLPVANAYKNKVNGIVQDISGSGNTTFIEPERLVRLNNQLAILKGKEKQEIARILLEISHEVGGCSEALKTNNRLIGYLDFLQSKALFGEAFHCHMGQISEDGSLFIPGARHPLLDQKKVVANDFSISANCKIIIISGPNAGGKTIALKTLGCLCLMFSCAVPLPCLEGAIVPRYQNIFADIGDSQSISDNLSTFSGHVSKLSYICNAVGGKDLVLLDEVGTGTSPKEGEALARAVTKYLLSKHCTAIISSHFEGLKAFAFDHESVENASMLFDDEKLLPTYKIQFGLPGESYGLKVAKRFGLPEKILEDAVNEMSSSADLGVSKAIERLSKLSKENEDLKASLAKQKFELEKKERDLTIKENNLRQKEEKSVGEWRNEKKILVDKAKSEIDDLMKELSKPGVKLHQVIQAKKRLEDLDEKKQESTFDTVVSVGDYVKVPEFDLVGKVQRIQGNRVYVITPDGLSFETKMNQVLPSLAPEKKKTRGSGARLDSVGRGPSVPMELNIIGLHVDEAACEIAKYLDACRLKGYKKVRIIHGYGSGALRQLTHDYLRKHANFVEKFELGGEFDGGSGATVVYLK